MAHVDDASVMTPEAVERFLTDFLRSRGLTANLHDATAYSVLGQGKRFRPILCMQACVACGGTATAAMAAGAAIELVHCFSLVHDDLPALDNDDLRRGRPTLHRHAGEAMAILAGDLMLTMAFSLLAEHVPSAPSLVRELAAATEGMILGQVHDTLGGLDEALTPLERVERIHANKTGALIVAACRMGVQCAAASGVAPPASAMDAITTYARSLGVLFQVTDDLLDVTQTAEHVGKRTGKDAAAGKLTYPGLLGIEGTREAARRHAAEAHAALSTFGQRAEALHRTVISVLERTK
jgi:geranylgeranyl diphosphate synthase type II